MINLNKVSYLLKSATHYFQPKKCPYCDQVEFDIVDTKYLVTQLLSCKSCNLMFRHPQDNANYNFKFYNNQYEQEGITTDLPDPATLQNFIDTKFENTLRSIDASKQILNALVGNLENKSILDYGCSWGYTTWQFQDIGMKAQGFEIGKGRAEFGKKNLNVKIATSIDEIKIDPFDFVYSSHVIEHLVDINGFVNTCLEKLKPEGFIVLLCPNASNDLRAKNPENFHLFWGEVHPNMISDKFLKVVFKDYPYFISSSSYNMEKIGNWDQKNQIVDLNGGDELLCIVKKTV